MESRSTCNHDLRFENLSRQELLSRLTPGDIVHGIARNGAILLCLVVALDETSILTRRITTQEPYRFDPITGAAISDDGQTRGRITSVEPLPLEIHNVFLDMDRQYRLGYRKDRDFKLSDQWKKSLLYIHDHYARHPIGE